MTAWIKISVTEVFGSAPRDVGTQMFVSQDGQSGTIGGGALEWRAVAHARELQAGLSDRWYLELPLGPALAQCCGGHVRLDFECVHDIQTSHTSLARLHLYGLGHVGRAVLQAIDPLPIDVFAYDERSEWQKDLPNGNAILFSHYVATLADGDFHLVMTHSHALDLTIVKNVLRDGRFGWLGLIGSATKRKRFERSLRAEHISNPLIDRLVCPIGIQGITDKSPAVIAASATAQILRAAEAYGLMGRKRQLVTAPE